MSTESEFFEPLRGARCRVKLSAAEMEIYRRTLADAPSDWFTRADESIIAELARVEVELDEVRAQIAAAPRVMPSSHGPNHNPLIMQQHRLRRCQLQLREALRLTPVMRAKKFALTKLGRVRAETEASAQAVADATPASRAHLMFGGRRAAEALGLDDDD